MPKPRSTKKDGTPRKIRSDKGVKRPKKSAVTVLPGLATYVKPGRAARGYGAFVKAGGIFGAAAVRSTPKRKYTRKPKAEVLAGYVKPGKYVYGGRKLMMSGGIFANKPQARKPTAYNQYVKNTYATMKAKMPGASPTAVMRSVAASWNGLKKIL
jgi:mannose-1-phosphate guanylyltransferase